jgi:hypothetical protein
LLVTNDGTRPTDLVPGDMTAKIFCNHDCHRQWQTKHCAWCGASPETGTLTTRITGGVADAYFCDVAHLQAHQGHLKAKAAEQLS